MGQNISKWSALRWMLPWKIYSLVFFVGSIRYPMIWGTQWAHPHIIMFQGRMFSAGKTHPLVLKIFKSGAWCAITTDASWWYINILNHGPGPHRIGPKPEPRDVTVDSAAGRPTPRFSVASNQLEEKTKNGCFEHTHFWNQWNAVKIQWAHISLRSSLQAIYKAFWVPGLVENAQEAAIFGWWIHIFL